MRKAQILMNELVYFSLSILYLSKTVRYKFWYDYVKPNYDENGKLCYIDTDSFIVHVKQKIFIKILQKMLQQDLTLQILNQTNHCLKKKVKKSFD